MHLARPILSLFAGAGGMDLGFEAAGFRPRVAIDNDPDAIATYRRNHPDVHAEQRDLSDVRPQEIVKLWRQITSAPPAGVIGGPPCQAFSCANRHLRDGDIRRELPRRYAYLLKGLNRVFHLQFFVFENVRGLESPLHHPDYEVFKAEFKQAGFRLFDTILDAQNFGVPQRRRRLFTVGLNEEDYPSALFHFPSPPALVPLRTVRHVISELPEPVFFRRGLNGKDIPFHPNHWTMQPRSRRFRDPNHKISPKSKDARSFRVLDWDLPSHTVAYGNREVHLHPEGHRRLSVYEAMRLQDFPSSYVLEGTLSAQISQVSNAVPPALAMAVAAAIGTFLNEADAPYHEILDGLQVGEGAEVELEPGETERVVKRQLSRVAAQTGYAIKWHSPINGRLRFQLISKSPVSLA